MVEGKSRAETIEKAINQSDLLEKQRLIEEDSKAEAIRKAFNKAKTEEKQKLIDEFGYDPIDLVTTGNHSYLKLDNWDDGQSWENGNRILRILNSFEKSNPSLETTNWRFHSYNHYNSTRIAGLWIDHKKKS